MDGESCGAAAEVRSVVNALWTASLSASVIVLVGPLGVFVPSETPVSPEGGVIGLFGQMVKVVEFENSLKEGREAAEKGWALVDQTVLAARVLVLEKLGFVAGS